LGSKGINFRHWAASKKKIGQLKEQLGNSQNEVDLES